jgi:hypothetical protein
MHELLRDILDLMLLRSLIKKLASKDEPSLKPEAIEDSLKQAYRETEGAKRLDALAQAAKAKSRESA